jgi:hypothetical protein
MTGLSILVPLLLLGVLFLIRFLAALQKELSQLSPVSSFVQPIQIAGAANTAPAGDSDICGAHSRDLLAASRPGPVESTATWERLRGSNTFMQ